MRGNDDERKAHESLLSCSCSEEIVRGEAEYEVAEHVAPAVLLAMTGWVGALRNDERLSPL